MVFKRPWESCCPHIWDSWEGDGVTWVIRDLLPEDDEKALDILMENMCPDEALCTVSNFMSDPVSVRSMRIFWRGCVSQRMSLGCYEEKDGKSKLVALNVCLVNCEGDEPNEVIEGRAWTNVHSALKVCEESVDCFKLMGIDKILYALGLVVLRDYRGAKLGARILAAREPLALYHGIKGSSTVFTGVPSQRSAERAGFKTVSTVTYKDLSDAGLNYPRDDTKSIKLMIKKFG